MHELALLRDLAVIWVSALIAGYICVWLKQPIIAGYIVAGIVIGPGALKLIGEHEQVSTLAEFGVALLLFVLGVELSLKQIFSSSSKVVITGIFQIAATVLGVWGLAYVTGLSTNLAEGFLFGCICALSSSVVITKILTDRGELDSVHGQLLIPVLLIQDLSIVPLIALMPTLNGPGGAEALSAILPALAKAGIMISFIFWASTQMVPLLLSKVVHSNYRELFLLTIISLCMTIALASSAMGLSLALGAFLAGIMISESTYGHQALTELLPLKDLFSVVFFVSVGLLLNPSFIAEHLFEVGIFVVVLIIGKAVIGTIAARISTPSQRASILVGVGLAQIGEFSFVVATLGNQTGIVSKQVYNLFFAGAVVSLVAAPFLMGLAPAAMRKLAFSSGKSADRRLKERNEEEEEASHLSGHLILCGYGRVGRNLGAVLHSFGLKFVVIELNAAIFGELEEKDVPVIYGDSSSRTVLLKAGLRTASSLIITIYDPLATMTLIDTARAINPGIQIVARAHRFEDISVFRAAGANAVVQPEFEASIEITRLALLSLNQADPDIKTALNSLRTKRYMLFQPDIQEPSLDQLLGFVHEDYLGAWFKITSDALVGKSIRDLDIRGKTGATVLAIRRGDRLVAHPSPTEEMQFNDELYVVGEAHSLAEFQSEMNFTRFCPLTEVTSDDISTRQSDNQTSGKRNGETKDNEKATNNGEATT
jgi:Kef-type K+ transport system, predicted NAD-binding component